MNILTSLPALPAYSKHTRAAFAETYKIHCRKPTCVGTLQTELLDTYKKDAVEYVMLD